MAVSAAILCQAFYIHRKTGVSGRYMPWANLFLPLIGKEGTNIVALWEAPIESQKSTSVAWTLVEPPNEACKWKYWYIFSAFGSTCIFAWVSFNFVLDTYLSLQSWTPTCVFSLGHLPVSLVLDTNLSLVLDTYLSLQSWSPTCL